MTSRLKSSFSAFACVLSALAVFSTAAADSPAPPEETRAEFDARMAWFREARFGMFIHWGLYAIPAGEWAGKKYDSGVEWIQSKAAIPKAEYLPLIDRFNPRGYDPDAWVRLAKEAGMKYIILTSKHHDGFCLWPSAQTDWDVGSSPWGRDLIQPLAEACARHGLRLGFYHSIMDWHHPQYGGRQPWRGNAATTKPDMAEFKAYLKAQLEELLEYRPAVMWFDGEWESCWTHEDGKEIYGFLRAKDPALLINNRVDKGRKGMAGFNTESKFKGDFGTPEQGIPASGLPGVDWEVCMTMNNTWGFSAHDHNWKSTRELLRNLIDIVSKGGNYLLNIGPDANGVIPGGSVERLKEIGAWMKVNGEAVHGSGANPFPEAPAWGRCTTRALADGDSRIYLHVFDWPRDGKLEVKNLRNEVKNATLLAAPDTEVTFSTSNGDLVLSLPTAAPDEVASVIALDVKGSVERK